MLPHAFCFSGFESKVEVGQLLSRSEKYHRKDLNREVSVWYGVRVIWRYSVSCPQVQKSPPLNASFTEKIQAIGILVFYLLDLYIESYKILILPALLVRLLKC